MPRLPARIARLLAVTALSLGGLALVASPSRAAPTSTTFLGLLAMDQTLSHPLTTGAGAMSLSVTCITPARVQARVFSGTGGSPSLQNTFDCSLVPTVFGGTVVGGAHRVDMTNRSGNFLVLATYTVTATYEAPGTEPPSPPTTSPPTTSPPTTTPTTTPPAGAVRPGPGSTGVPAGTVLTPMSGNVTLGQDGQILDRVEVNGCIDVTAKNVTIRRSRVRCNSGHGVRVHPGTTGALIEDTEVVGTSATVAAGVALEGSATARRLNVHGVTDGVKLEANATLESSWIHDLWMAPGDHADGVQSTGSYGGMNVTIRNNFIDVVDHGRGHGDSATSCLIIGNEFGRNGNYLIEANWLYGGGYAVYFHGGKGNNRLVNNRIGKGPAQVAGQPPYPQYGPMNVTTTAPDTVVSGTVWDGTGMAAT